MVIEYLERGQLPKLAYRRLEALPAGENLPTVLFCGGFRSDMEGTKAQYIEGFCCQRGQACVRFDYSGHGSSSGDFADGTIGSWLDDTFAVLDNMTSGPVLIIGSSMGGWIALLAALSRPERIIGLIGLAAAPDFTRELYNEQLDDGMRAQLKQQGYIDLSSEYSPEPYRITKALIEDGEKRCLLDGKIPLEIPMRLIQGMQDPDVPWQKSYRIKNALPDELLCEVTLIESGDHRLSRPEDLEILGGLICDLSR